jgi:hypothetical protein
VVHHTIITGKGVKKEVTKMSETTNTALNLRENVRAKENTKRNEMPDWVKYHGSEWAIFVVCVILFVVGFIMVMLGVPMVDYNWLVTP